jgi:hypothetical protein
MLKGMSTIDAFLAVVDAYRDALNVSDGSVSSRLFNAGHRISQIRAGSDIGVRRLSEALQWLSDNWPVNAVWPDHVERPLPAAPAPETSDAA